jgi:dipeptidyl-peptidase-3
MSNFKYHTENFADIRILRYQVPNFDRLSTKQKIFAYHLGNAALAGRDIYWDQNYHHNLWVRANLENIYISFKGKRETECFKQFEVYLKRIWFSNGIHHHYSSDKILPEFSNDCFRQLIESSDSQGFKLGFSRSIDEMIAFFIDNIFNPDIDATKVFQDEKEDLVQKSAVNFYQNVTQQEAEDFYQSLPNDKDRPLSLGLNSRLIKKEGKVQEEVWKIGGKYHKEIQAIIHHLKLAIPFAETEHQSKTISLLIDYYQSGDLSKFDAFNIHWVSDHGSDIDFINGFIETYDDPLGRKATWESTVQMIDYEANERVKAISDHAEWFEKNSPIDSAFKKDKIEGVSARAIDVIMEAGATSPSTPIGINLPNADWIRSEYGSKSVTISNIMNAYDEVSRSSGALKEFALDDNEIALSKKWGMLATNLHVDMHEIIGHGSGKMAPGVGETADTLKNHASTIEEARADLVALYYALDPKLIELGLMPSLEPGIAEYNSYIRGGLMTQLVRIELGKNLEEAHMRNRQLIAKWAYDMGQPENVIEKIRKNNKSYFKVNDHQKLRSIFAIQLREIQRIKSTGDYEAACQLIDKYAVQIDSDIHAEVLVRWKKLNIPPYSGFINPKMEAIYKDQQIMDVKIHYPDDFANQMLDYAKFHSNNI